MEDSESQKSSRSVEPVCLLYLTSGAVSQLIRDEEVWSAAPHVYRHTALGDVHSDRHERLPRIDVPDLSDRVWPGISPFRLDHDGLFLGRSTYGHVGTQTCCRGESESCSDQYNSERREGGWRVKSARQEEVRICSRKDTCNLAQWILLISSVLIQPGFER